MTENKPRVARGQIWTDNLTEIAAPCRIMVTRVASEAIDRAEAAEAKVAQLLERLG